MMACIHAYLQNIKRFLLRRWSAGLISEEHDGGGECAVLEEMIMVRLKYGRTGDKESQLHCNKYEFAKGCALLPQVTGQR